MAHDGHMHEVVNELFVSEQKAELENYDSGKHHKRPDDPADIDVLVGATADSLDKDKSFNKSIRQSFNLEAQVAHEVEGVPDMWSWNYCGLYSQYAAVGLLYGTSGALIPLCVYSYDGPTNVCSNARNIVFFAWNLKIFFAVLTDTYRPFGLRRKPWMIAGWSMVLVLLFILAVGANHMNISAWLTLQMLMQGFLMLSDVPADGYSVELGKLESKEQRGQILATGQRIRFSFCVVAGVIQCLLLNGPTTNSDDCSTDFEDCWAWGLRINEYYALLFCIVFVLTIPVFFLKELDPSKIPQHTFKFFLEEIWDTLQNLTTFYLLVFVIGTISFTNFTNNANIYLQYYVIELTNFEAGIDTITTYMALVISIWIFQKFLINRNWRITQYGSTIFASLLGLVWIAPYYNAGGTMDPWFTIFIDLDTSFAQGLSQVLYSMAVIELAKKGQEATTYELIVTVGNAAITMNGVISTQLLTPLNAVGCDNDDDSSCASNTVAVSDKHAYYHSDGPKRFTNYCLTLLSISIVATLIFVRFLPASKDECHEWKRIGAESGNSALRGKITVAMIVVMVLYGTIVAILLIDVKTACEPMVGGTGC